MPFQKWVKTKIAKTARRLLLLRTAGFYARWKVCEVIQTENSRRSTSTEPRSLQGLAWRLIITIITTITITIILMIIVITMIMQMIAIIISE